MFEKTITRLFKFFKINKDDMMGQYAKITTMTLTLSLHELMVLLIDQRRSKEEVLAAIKSFPQNTSRFFEKNLMNSFGSAPKANIYAFAEDARFLIPDFIEKTVSESGRTDLTWFVDAVKEAFKK